MEEERVEGAEKENEETIEDKGKVGEDAMVIFIIKLIIGFCCHILDS